MSLAVLLHDCRSRWASGVVPKRSAENPPRVDTDTCGWEEVQRNLRHDRGRAPLRHRSPPHGPSLLAVVRHRAATRMTAPVNFERAAASTRHMSELGSSCVRCVRASCCHSAARGPGRILNNTRPRRPQQDLDGLDLEIGCCADADVALALVGSRCDERSPEGGFVERCWARRRYP